MWQPPRPAPPLFREEAAPVLCFPLEVWRRLRLFILRCPIEISGFGVVRQSPDNPMLFMVEEIIVLDQVADEHSATPDPSALGTLLYELTLQDKADALRLLWHSHVKMPAYFSSVDIRTISEFSGEWMISLVSNHHGDVSARLDVIKPYWAGTPMRVKVMIPSNPELTREVDAEIRAHVRRPRMFLRGVTPHGPDHLMLEASEVETDE